MAMKLTLESGSPLDNRNNTGVDHLLIDRENAAWRDATLGLAGVVPGSILGGADTLLQSVGLIDENDMADSLRAINTVAGETYEKNKNLYRGIGDVGTMFIGAGLASKAIRGGGMAMNALGRMGTGGKYAEKLISTNYDRVDALARLYRQRGFAASMSGNTNVNALSSVNKVRMETLKLSAANNVRDAVAGEAFVAAFQNKSELFFPEGQTWADTAAMSVLGGGIGVGVGHVVTSARLRKTAAAMGDKLVEAHAGVTGHAGTDIVAGAFEVETVRQGPLNSFTRNDEEARGVFQQRSVAGKQIIKDATAKLMNNTPVAGVSTGNVADNIDVKEVADTMSDLALTQPRLVANTISIEMPKAGALFNNAQAGIVKKKQKELADLQAEIKQMPMSGEKDTALFKAERLQQEIDLVEKGMYVVDVNKLGLIGTHGDMTPTVFNRDYKVKKLKPSLKNAENHVFKIAQDNGKGGQQLAIYGIAENGSVMAGDKVLRSTRGMDVDNISQIYAAMPRALDSLRTKLNDANAIFGKPTKIDARSTLETLDFALKAIDTIGNGNMRALSKVFEIHPQLGTVKDLKHLAMSKRYERFVEAKTAGVTSPHDLTIMTNLRMSDDYGVHAPTYEWFEDLYATKGANGYKKIRSYDDALQAHRANFAFGASPNTVKELLSKSHDAMDGLLEFDMVNRLGKPKAPMSLFVRNNYDQLPDETLRNYRDLARIEREVVTTRLRNAALNPSVPSFLGPVAMHHQQNKAMIDSLRETLPRQAQAQVSEPLLGAKAGQLSPLTRNHRLRHTPAGAGASSHSDSVMRITREGIREWTKSNLQAVQAIRLRANTASRQLYLAYHSEMQKGWRLKSDVVDTQTGMFELATDGADAVINAEIARSLKIPLPTHLPDPLRGSKHPLVLDELAATALEEIRYADRLVYNGNQMLLRAVGKAPRDYLKGHSIVPTPRGQDVVFITDEIGNVVDHVIARTLDAAKQSAAKRIAIKKAPGRFNIVTKADVESYKLLMDEAFNSSALDISDSFALTAGRGTEAGRTGLFDDNFVDTQLDELLDLVLRQANRYTATEFAPELNQMRHMQNLANVTKFNKEGVKTYDDVYDMTASLLLNTSDRNAGSAYAKIDRVIEDSLNGALNTMYDAYNKSKFARSRNARNAMSIAEALHKQTGYHPVKQVAEVIAASGQANERVRNDVRDIANKMGSLTQQVALKFFETGHALLTTASVMTTIPHSMAILRPIGNETDQARKARLGYIADFLPNGMVIPSEGRLMMSTINKWMRGDYQQVIEEATKLGYLDAPMGEFASALGVPMTKTTAGTWMKKVLDTSGALSAGSERFARTLSFLNAYELFNGAGKQGKRISMTVANDMANRIIADYRPGNKAELFKGVSGIPLGMFQTFAINYFEKMYSAIENKNLRELAIRTGTQAFVFGGSSVAGYDFLNEMVFNNWDNTNNPEQYLKQGADKGVADLMLYGTLSNLPKILGIGDGMALHTRGEMQTPKVLSPFNFSETPVVNFTSRSLNFMSEALKSVMQNGDLGFDAMQEALIMAMPNRPLRGMFELAQGYSTNSNNDLVNTDTRDLASVVSRLAGLKPLREAEEAKALWMNRETDLAQRAKNIRLRKALQAKLRDDGGLTGKEYNEFIQKYIDNGGSVSGAKRWMKTNAKKALRSKFDLELEHKLRNDPEGAETLRLMELDF